MFLTALLSLASHLTNGHKRFLIRVTIKHMKNKTKILYNYVLVVYRTISKYK